jgi:hypothetical protein
VSDLTTNGSDQGATTPSFELSGAEMAGLLLAMALVGLFAFRPVYAVDLFWLLTLGKQISLTGEIPHQDLFSAVHPNSPWVHFQWLWELLGYEIVSAFGLVALRAINALLLALSFGGLYVLLRGRSGGRGLAAMATAVAVVAFQDRFQLRPDALNFVFWVASLFWLSRPASARRAGLRSLVLMGLLACLWSNFHGGGVLVLLLSLGACALGRTLARTEGAREDWLLLLAALVGAGLSPAFFLGLSDFAEIWRPMMSTGNREWMPAHTMLDNGWHPNFVIVAALPSIATLTVLARVLRSWRTVDWGQLLVVVLWLSMAHLFVRAVFLAVFSLLWSVEGLLQSSGERGSPRGRWWPWAVWAALVGVVVHYNAYFGRQGLAQVLHMAVHYDLEPRAYPEESAEFLRDAGLEGGVLNEGKWAGYLIWRTWPSCRYFADSRHHLTPEMWSIFQRLHHPTARREALDEGFARYGLGLAVLEGPAFPLRVPPPEWELIYKAGPQEVYLRRDSEAARINRPRAVQWLAEQGIGLGPDASSSTLQDAAIHVGAQQWLAHPWQREELARAQSLVSSAASHERARGHRAKGLLLFTAGLYAAALPELDASLEQEPNHLRALHAKMWCAFMLQDRATARQIADDLEPRSAELGNADRARLVVLQRELARAEASSPGR